MKRTILAALAAVTLAGGIAAPFTSPASAAEYDVAQVSGLSIDVNPGLQSDTRDQKVEARGTVTSAKHGVGTVTVSSPRSGAYTCATGTSSEGTFALAYASGHTLSGPISRLSVTVGGSFEVDATLADGDPFALRAAPVREVGGTTGTQTCLDSGNNGRSKTLTADEGTATTGVKPAPTGPDMVCGAPGSIGDHRTQITSSGGYAIIAAALNCVDKTGRVDGIVDGEFLQVRGIPGNPAVGDCATDFTVTNPSPEIRLGRPGVTSVLTTGDQVSIRYTRDAGVVTGTQNGRTGFTVRGQTLEADFSAVKGAADLNPNNRGACSVIFPTDQAYEVYVVG